MHRSYFEHQFSLFTFLAIFWYGSAIPTRDMKSFSALSLWTFSGRQMSRIGHLVSYIVGPSYKSCFSVNSTFPGSVHPLQCRIWRCGYPATGCNNGHTWLAAFPTVAVTALPICLPQYSVGQEGRSGTYQTSSFKPLYTIPASSSTVLKY